MPLLKSGLLLKKRICSQGKGIFPFREDPTSEGVKSILTELLPLQLYPFRLSFTTLWSNSADNKLMIRLLFFPENRLWYFMQIVSLGDNLHEISKPILWEKKAKYFKMSAEMFTQNAKQGIYLIIQLHVLCGNWRHILSLFSWHWWQMVH